MPDAFINIRIRQELISPKSGLQGYRGTSVDPCADYCCPTLLDRCGWRGSYKLHRFSYIDSLKNYFHPRLLPFLALLLRPTPCIALFVHWNRHHECANGFYEALH